MNILHNYLGLKKLLFVVFALKGCYTLFVGLLPAKREIKERE